MSYLDDMKAEIATIVKAVIPAIDDAHIYTTIQALQKNIVEEVAASASYVPAVVIEYGSEGPANLSIDSDAVLCPVTIYYVDANSKQKTIGDKLALIKAGIRTRSKAGSLVSFDLHEDPGAIDTGAGNAINSALLIDSKTNISGGSLTYSGLLITPYG